MRADLGKIYDHTITVINKLDAKDSLLKKDAYYKTVIPHCMWAVRTTRTVQSDGTVNIGTVHSVQIPENADYMPYREWKNAPDRDERFTIRTGDYIVLGEVTEEITASTIKPTVNLYEPDAFQVQTFRDATKGAGFTHSTKGIMRFTEPYVIEG